MRTEEIVTDKAVVARSYLRTWFVPDVVSTFPYEWFLMGNAGVAGLVQLVRVRRAARGRACMHACTRAWAEACRHTRCTRQPVAACARVCQSNRQSNTAGSGREARRPSMRMAKPCPGPACTQALRLVKVLRMLRLVKLVKLSRSSLLLHVSTLCACAAPRAGRRGRGGSGRGGEARRGAAQRGGLCAACCRALLRV